MYDITLAYESCRYAPNINLTLPLQARSRKYTTEQSCPISSAIASYPFERHLGLNVRSLNLAHGLKVHRKGVCEMNLSSCLSKRR
jgi:hypothetical protein